MDSPCAIAYASIANTRAHLELRAQHELQLPGQSRTRVWRRSVVVVVIEVHGSIDHAKARAGLRYVPGSVRVRHVVKLNGGRISQLNVVEDVKGLDPELQRKSLGQFCFLHQSHVHLPGVQSAHDTVSGVAKSSHRSRRGIRVEVLWRSLKRVRIDPWQSVLPSPGQIQRHPRNDVRPLVRLIVAVWKLVWLDIVLDRQRMAGMP